MTGRNPIDRTDLVQCIACKGWVTPEERLRAAFVGGHNVRFYVCHACIGEYKQKRYCRTCGALLTGKNIHLERNSGKRMNWRPICLSCMSAENNLKKSRKRLLARFPHIVKTEGGK